MRKNGARWQLAALAAVAFVGMLDYVTPPDLDFDLYYLAPLVAIAWSIGLPTALAGAALAMAIELFHDVALAPHFELAVVFNEASRVAVYVGAAVLIDRLYQERQRHRDRDRDRDRFLALLEREFSRPVAALRGVAASIRGVTTIPELRQTLPSLQDQVEDISFLTTDILAIGHLQRGRLLFATDEVDLRRAVNAAVPGAERDRVIVSSAAEQPVARGDEDRFRHALASVMTHVLEAAPHDFVSLLIRRSDSEAGVEIAYRGAVEDQSLDFARLLLEGQGGRLVRRAREQQIGSLIALWLPR